MFLENPPEQRYAGWNMDTVGPARLTQFGFNRGDGLFRELALLWNGHCEFVTEIDDSFSWRQDSSEFQDHPLLYPYPVVEYPVSFSRFVSTLYDHAGYQGSVLLRMEYWNIKGAILRPGHPNSIGFTLESSTFDEGDDFASETSTELPIMEDRPAYKLIVDLYAAFGFGEDAIPFFSQGSARIS